MKSRHASLAALATAAAAVLVVAATPAAMAQASIARPATVSGALSADERREIDRLVAAELERTGVPGAQVAVVRDGRIVLSKGYGRASTRLGTMTADQQMPIASNSKQFLGALMLLLEAEGKVSLDDPVSRWMPEVADARQMTVRQLLAHTAGLQDYWPQDYMFSAMTRAVTPQAIVTRWGRQPLDYAPGTQWQYSNTGYVVAGLIAERAGGAPLWDQFDRRFFKPLGMRVISQDDAIGGRFPAGHIRAALGPVREFAPPGRGWLWAAGEFATSAGDVALWNIARIDRMLLPASLWESQETAYRLSDGRATGYGLGVQLRDVDGRRVVSHTGGAEGYFSINTVWPRERIAVTVLTNGSFSGASGAIHDAVARVVLPAQPAAGVAEPERVDDAQRLLEQMIAGQHDPGRFTANWLTYFTRTIREDYRSSLSALGPLQSLTLAGPPRPRGGFVQRRYTARFADRTVTINSYAEPGATGRWEQFLINP